MLPYAEGHIDITIEAPERLAGPGEHSDVSPRDMLSGQDIGVPAVTMRLARADRVHAIVEVALDSLRSQSHGRRTSSGPFDNEVVARGQIVVFKRLGKGGKNQRRPRDLLDIDAFTAITPQCVAVGAAREGLESAIARILRPSEPGHGHRDEHDKGDVVGEIPAWARAPRGESRAFGHPRLIRHVPAPPGVTRS